MALHFPFSSSTYQQRRQQLMRIIGNKKILFLANEENAINFKDNVHPYRQDSTVLYYSGIALPNIAILLNGYTGETTLFGDDVSIDTIVWTGPLPLMVDIAAQCGIEHILPYSNLEKMVDKETLYLPPYRASQQTEIQRVTGESVLSPSVALIKAIVSQRSYKTDEEITQLEEAVALSRGMHAYVQEHADAGMYEYELVAKASQYAIENNARWSFNPIMTINGETLHNHYYGNKITESDMILFDGGIEVASGYCGDITRTFPGSGKFSALQQNVCDIVKSAYDAAIDFAKPGMTFRDTHLHASERLVEGLTDLGWMKGNAKDAVSAGAHTMFFQCGLGHMMGLDVHDMENYGEQYVGYSDEMIKSKEFGLKSLRLGKALEESFVLTIEPGIYVIPQLIDKFYAEGKFKDFINYAELQKNRDFGGIRIEDDFVVEKDGVRLLGSSQELGFEF